MHKEVYYITSPICRSYSHQDEISSCFNFLKRQIEEIDKYPDKSLFFQHPYIIERWLELARAIENIKSGKSNEDDKKWEDRTDPYVVPLLNRRELFLKYKKLYQAYYEQLKKVINVYDGWLGGDLISEEVIEALNNDHYENDLNVEEGFSLFIENLNNSSRQARFEIYSTLTSVLTLLLTIMNRSAQIIKDQNPSDEDIAKAIDDDLREWTLQYGDGMFEEMIEELDSNFKEYLTDEDKPELWGEMLRADEEALKLAMKQQLSECNDDKQEHWGEDMKAKMDESGELMRTLYSSFRTRKLLDLNDADNVKPFIELLTSENLGMFYDIIVRRSLIQCEIFPELKAQHDEWLKGNIGAMEEVEEAVLNDARQSKLDEIIGILQNGNWKAPATTENISLLLNTVFGRDTSLLEEGDEPLCEKMWALVEGGSGNRMEIVPANLAGFFSEENLIIGSPLEISNDCFGKNNNQSNNINKGKANYCSRAFSDVIPFIRKYISKIIRKA